MYIETGLLIWLFPHQTKFLDVFIPNTFMSEKVLFYMMNIKHTQLSGSSYHWTYLHDVLIRKYFSEWGSR